ncbi:hypothetical protein Tsubulata_048273 [Turnera subulata]|uniref:Uncharacterized protein n=1 Tax=Turnera subulata TaxID=218843 RepID=A0A9Q0GEQ3_9ROSI|nr:hypothetical protein Tsubulata_048273 [Turnera subulata]
MGSRPGVDLWAEVIAEEGRDRNPETWIQQQPEQPVYQRRRRAPQSNTLQDANLVKAGSNKENRVSFVGAAGKRISWNRSLSTRGRVSIAVAACVENKPQRKQARKKGRPPVPKVWLGCCFNACSWFLV